MKKLKYNIISFIFIFLIFYQLIFQICISEANDIEDNNIYDIILFWGQSDMTCYCGMNDYEREKDTRYDYTNANSVKAFSKKTGIEEDILSNSVKMNFVKVRQEQSSAYEYYYVENKLQELNENTNFSGEQLKYNSSTKKLENATTSSYSIQKSDGTTVIPKFCQEYYKKTGHKVVAVLASNGGEQIQNFLPATDSEYGDNNKQYIYEAMLEKYQSAVNCVINKYGQNAIGNKLWISFQGDSNVRNTSTSEYKRLFLKVHNYIKKDFGITKGAIIETAHTVGTNLYTGVKNIHNAQEQLANENSDIIIGSTYAYNRYIPDEDTYNSSDFNNDIFKDSNGNKLSYTTAYNIATSSVCFPDNLPHLTSAALSQIGKETAESLAEEIRDKVSPQVQVQYDIIEKTDKDVTVTIIANEPVKEVSGWTRSSDKKTLTKVYTENKIEEIKIYDLEDNESKVTIMISNIDKEKLQIKINNDYEITENKEKKYVEKILPNTTIETIENSIETNGTIEIYKDENRIQNKKIVLGTGMVIKIKRGNEEVMYEAVVKGDITGDGNIKMADILKLAKYKSGVDKNLSEVYLKAGDVIKDGKIGMQDILKLARVLARIENI